MRGQPSSSATLKKIRLKVLQNGTIRSNRTTLLVENGRKIGSCRIRCAHTAPPIHAQKWATPFFGFAHPPPDKRVA